MFWMLSDHAVSKFILRSKKRSEQKTGQVHCKRINNGGSAMLLLLTLTREAKHQPTDKIVEPLTVDEKISELYAEYIISVLKLVGVLNTQTDYRHARTLLTSIYDE